MKYQGKITDPKDLVTKEYVDTGLSGKLGTSGDGSNVTAAFTAASSRTNISTGEKLSVIFGKIAKWFADLGAAAFRGVDSVPTDNSTNLVESGGVKSAIDNHYVTAGKSIGSTLGNKATAEGVSNIASGNCSHAEGAGNVASGNSAHAEGEETAASGANAHAEGSATVAEGLCSHAEGDGTRASGYYSHAEGLVTNATRKSQHVFGEYNIADTGGADTATRGTYVEIVGNGTTNANKSNARTLDWSGNEVLAGKLTLGAGPTANMDAATKKYVDDAIQAWAVSITQDANTNVLSIS